MTDSSFFAQTDPAEFVQHQIISENRYCDAIAIYELIEQQGFDPKQWVVKHLAKDVHMSSQLLQS